ncbi:undecaprenyldiphospho-muramoylpentapeptide beta-N-acetylglucosaminyltransferase [bacterium J17]|nr:undecaprenyldiphospho-muramoylpentapeptide beta-N-acetylglucosaminyltransferase [bacterium J17]
MRSVIAIAAGGTGGHVIPAIAVAEALREERPELECIFIGTGQELEHKLVKASGFDLVVLPALPFVGGGVLGKLRYLLYLPMGLFMASKLLVERKVDAVLGFGGYPSVMPSLAAKLLRKPLFIHEQNVAAGAANKLLGLLAKIVFAVPGARGFLRKNNLVYFGNPVRKSFTLAPKWEAPSADISIKLLVTGGSQGAVSLNSAVISLLDRLEEEAELKDRVELLHQVGNRDFDRVAAIYRERGRGRFRAVPFVEDMASAYADCDLVISRAGAMTVAEILASKRPAVFVPLPIAGGHQARNVEKLAEVGACKMLPQDEQLEQNLSDLVISLLRSPAQLEEMVDAMSDLVELDPCMAAERISKRILENLCD